MRLNIEHAGHVLIYQDEHEQPLRYALHHNKDDAMRQAQIEYGVHPGEWEAEMRCLPWKS